MNFCFISEVDLGLKLPEVVKNSLLEHVCSKFRKSSAERCKKLLQLLDTLRLIKTDLRCVTAFRGIVEVRPKL